MRLKCELCTSPIKKHDLENANHYLIKSEGGIGCVEVLNGTELNICISPRELQDKFGRGVRAILCDNKEIIK